MVRKTYKSKSMSLKREEQYLTRSIAMQKYYKRKNIRTGTTKIGRTIIDEIPFLKDALKANDVYNGAKDLKKAKRQHDEIKAKKVRLRQIQRQQRSEQTLLQRANYHYQLLQRKVLKKLS